MLHFLLIRHINVATVTNTVSINSVFCQGCILYQKGGYIANCIEFVLQRFLFFLYMRTSCYYVNVAKLLQSSIDAVYRNFRYIKYRFNYVKQHFIFVALGLCVGGKFCDFFAIYGFLYFVFGSVLCSFLFLWKGSFSLRIIMLMCEMIRKLCKQTSYTKVG